MQVWVNMHFYSMHLYLSKLKFKLINHFLLFTETIQYFSYTYYTFNAFHIFARIWCMHFVCYVQCIYHIISNSFYMVYPMHFAYFAQCILHIIPNALIYHTQWNKKLFAYGKHVLFHCSDSSQKHFHYSKLFFFFVSQLSDIFQILVLVPRVEC